MYGYLFRREQLDGLRFREGMTHAEDLLFYIEMSSRGKLNYDHVDSEVYNYLHGHSLTFL